jgi:hypothetical protein
MDMFGWLKRKPDSMDAELREATLKRLAQVLDLPEEVFADSETSPRIPPKTARRVRTEPELSRAC